MRCVRTFMLRMRGILFSGGEAMKTFMASPATIDRKWYVVDAEGMTLGRLASEVASVLRGKNKPIFTPHMDTGDYVIIVNAEKVKVTGRKLSQKMYYRHSSPNRVPRPSSSPRTFQTGNRGKSFLSLPTHPGSTVPPAFYTRIL